MKTVYKFLLPSFLLLLLTTVSFGQIGFGPRIGLNMANMVGVNTNTKFRPSLVIGAYAKLGLSDNIAFQPELLFSMKGAKYKNGTYKETLAQNYVDVPLLFNFGKSQGMHFLVGPQPSFLISSKDKSNFSGKDVITDTKKLYKGMDVGALFGLGYQAEGGFNLDLRFTYGMIAVFDDAAFAGFTPKKIHNINLQLTAGYTIGGK